MMGQKMRAVVVFDIDVNDIEDAVNFDKHLKGLVSKFKSPIVGIKIEQRTSGIPFKERRGKTGNINQIVFRGTRGPYKKRGEKK